MQVGSQHLEGDDAAHGAVLGLEDAAHAAAADLVEDAILAQQEAGGAADQQALGLEPGEQPLLDEGAGDASGRDCSAGSSFSARASSSG